MKRRGHRMVQGKGGVRCSAAEDDSVCRHCDGETPCECPEARADSKERQAEERFEAEREGL